MVKDNAWDRGMVRFVNCRTDRKDPKPIVVRGDRVTSIRSEAHYLKSRDSRGNRRNPR